MLRPSSNHYYRCETKQEAASMLPQEEREPLSKHNGYKLTEGVSSGERKEVIVNFLSFGCYCMHTVTMVDDGVCCPYVHAASMPQWRS